MPESETPLTLMSENSSEKRNVGEKRATMFLSEPRLSTFKKMTEQSYKELIRTKCLDMRIYNGLGIPSPKQHVSQSGTYLYKTTHGYYKHGYLQLIHHDLYLQVEKDQKEPGRMISLIPGVFVVGLAP